MSNLINLDHAQEIITSLALNAGDYSKRHLGKTEIQWKDMNLTDLRNAKWYIARCLTSVDLACQNIILEGLIQEEFHKKTSVLAEEKTELVSRFNADSDLQWVIDPIDGTFNYAMANTNNKQSLEKILNQPLNIDSNIYGIAIGLRKRDEGFLLSAVYLPILDSMYVARRGAGAVKNGSKQAIISACFDSESKIHLNSKSDTLKKIFTKYQQPLCTVYSVTCVADNSCNVFFARDTQLFDAGPASLIVSESGGYVCDENANPLEFSRINNEITVPVYIAGPNKSFNLEIISHIKKKGSIFHIDSD